MCKHFSILYYTYIVYYTYILLNMLNLKGMLKKQLQSSLPTAFKHVLSNLPS